MNTSRVEILAEAAQGYEGNPEWARLLAKGAIVAGADAVKFQLVYADELCAPGYQYYDLFKQLEMPLEVWQSVADIVSEGGGGLFFDVFGELSLETAKKVGATGVKIHTTDFYNSSLTSAALAEFDRVFISFGGVSPEQFESFLARHESDDLSKATFLFGFQAEPTPIENNHLRRLSSLQAAYPNLEFGFMDHSDGDSPQKVDLSLMAMALGAEVIEKHITVDRALEMEDYISALSISGFREYVDRIRVSELALGSPEIEPTELECSYLGKALKLCLASGDLPAGHVVESGDIAMLRPKDPNPDGICDPADLIGKTLNGPMSKFDVFAPESVK